MTLSLEWIDEREDGGGAREETWIGLLERLLAIAGRTEAVGEGIVTLTLTDDDGIRRLNREYRGLDKATDVLSFPLLEGEEPDIVFDGDYESVSGEDGVVWEDEEDAAGGPERLLGDIVISVPRAAAQADEYGHSFERELGFLFVHGFLHLLGYDHEDGEAERAMFAKQETVLTEAGLER